MKVIELNPAVGELGGVKCRINLSLLEDVSIGDYVIVHAGYAIEKLEEDVARQTIRLMKDLGAVPSRKRG
jgi:hydrogenase expression/formation protein HypC